MKDSIRDKLDKLTERHQELAAMLADPDVIATPEDFRKLSKEYADLEALVEAYEAYRAAERNQAEAEALREDADESLRAMAEDELASATERQQALEERLKRLLLPRDPNDEHNVYLEIRAGTGGDEAALFAGDLFRMYGRYAEARQWRVEVLSESLGDHGGYKEIIARVVGDDVYSRLKFESGAHRVQRVPVTESGGRIHTSACTVAVMPEPEEVDEVEINKNELRIDTFRSSGAGGQHVNTTDSAIRITHEPTGIVVECQEERSQHKNRARAMGYLQAKLQARAQAEQDQAQSEHRRELVGTGDRSDRIRTYNFPQGRVTDHRINLTLYKLNDVLEGSLDEIVEGLTHEHQADQLAALSESS